MRKPRDFDAELKALEDKARELKARKVQQLGELVIATGADALTPEELAGALSVLAETTDGRETGGLGEARGGDVSKQVAQTCVPTVGGDTGRAETKPGRTSTAIRRRRRGMTDAAGRWIGRKRTRQLIELGGLVKKARDRRDHRRRPHPDLRRASMDGRPAGRRKKRARAEGLAQLGPRGVRDRSKGESREVRRHALPLPDKLHDLAALAHGEAAPGVHQRAAPVKKIGARHRPAPPRCRSHATVRPRPLRDRHARSRCTSRGRWNGSRAP